MGKKFSKQEEYDQRQKEKGFVRVMTWIPENQRDNLRRYAAKKRKDFLAGKS